MMYDYRKLRGKITEKNFTLNEFAEKIGISNTSLNERLFNRRQFKQPEMYKAKEILSLASIDEYFFSELNTESRTK